MFRPTLTLIDKHIEAGKALVKIRANVFGIKVPMNKKTQGIHRRLVKAIDLLRSELEEELFKACRGAASTKIYYHKYEPEK